MPQKRKPGRPKGSKNKKPKVGRPKGSKNKKVGTKGGAYEKFFFDEDGLTRDVKTGKRITPGVTPGYGIDDYVVSRKENDYVAKTFKQTGKRPPDYFQKRHSPKLRKPLLTVRPRPKIQGLRRLIGIY